MNPDKEFDDSKSIGKDVQKDVDVINEHINENKRVVALTTIDNPYDPIDNFDEWYAFDMQKGYNSCAYLARIVSDSNKMIDEEIRKDTEEAIDEIIKYDFLGIYRKVVRESKW